MIISIEVITGPFMSRPGVRVKVDPGDMTIETGEQVVAFQTIMDKATECAASLLEAVKA